MNIGGVHSLLIQGFEEKVYEELRNLGDDILLHTYTDILYDRDHVSSGFIGSNSVLEERVGSIVSMLTAYGILVEGNHNAFHIESIDNTLGSKKPFPIIITPKRIAKTRNEIFQRIYELLIAIHSLDREERLFFNWNYNTFIENIFLQEEILTHRLLDRKESIARRELEETINSFLKSFTEKIWESVSSGSARDSLRRLVELLPIAYNDLFEQVASMKIFTGNKFNDIVDYTTLVIERSVFGILFYKLLDEARRQGTSIFWVTSNPDDNYISKMKPVLSWINDTVVLAYIWRNLDRAVLAVRDVADEVLEPPITYIDYMLRHEENNNVRVHVTSNLLYAKFARNGPIIQFLYPNIYKREDVEKGLRELYTVSDKNSGYPRPLVLIRKACRISGEVARGLGDSILRRISNPLLKTMLNRHLNLSENMF